LEEEAVEALPHDSKLARSNLRRVLNLVVLDRDLEGVEVELSHGCFGLAEDGEEAVAETSCRPVVVAAAVALVYIDLYCPYLQL
jgi:hypothetical protein